MLPIILVLLLALILFGAGFALKALWWIAVIVLVVWLLGFFIRPASTTAASAAAGTAGKNEHTQLSCGARQENLPGPARMSRNR